MAPVPDISDTLIEYLKSIYPIRLPDGPPSLWVIGKMQGKQEVIDHLIGLRKKQDRLINQ